MECHKCRYNGKSDPHCLSCREGGLSRHGKIFFSLETIRDCGRELSPAPDYAPGPESERVTDLPPEIEDRLREFFFRLFSLSEDKLLLIRHVFAGGSLAEFSRSKRLSRQRVSVMARDIVRKAPVFAPLFGKGKGRGKGGRFHQCEFYLPEGGHA